MTLSRLLKKSNPEVASPPSELVVHATMHSLEQLVQTAVATALGAHRAEPEYRDDAQEARRLGIGVHKLREEVAAGRIPCVFVGDRRRYLKSAVDAALAARKAGEP